MRCIMPSHLSALQRFSHGRKEDTRAERLLRYHREGKSEWCDFRESPSPRESHCALDRVGWCG